MPRPKRTKIASRQTQPAVSAASRKAALDSTSSSRTRNARSKSNTNLDEGEALAENAPPPASIDMAALERSPPRSARRPPLQDISMLQRSPFIGRNANRSPWADPKKAPVALDNGFEEFLQSSSPQLPPTTISRPPSAVKQQGTPSFLSIANFKRRPRQPSILRMVQQDTTDANEDGNEDLTLGSLGRSSPPRSGASPTQLAEAEVMSSGTKRKAGALESDHEQITAVDQGFENDDLPEQPAVNLRASIGEERQASVATAKTKPFKKTPPPRRRGRRVGQKKSSTAVAPSSSPPNSASSPHSTPPPYHGQVQAKSGGEAAAQELRVAKRRKTDRPSADSKTVTTASLKELLPKARTRAARQRHNDSFDDIDSLGSGDEELEDRFVDGSGGEGDDSEEYGHPKTKRSHAKRGDARKAKARQGKAGNTKSTTIHPAKGKSESSGKTYGRHGQSSDSDKENQPGESFFDGEDDDDNDDTMDTVTDANTAAIKDTLRKSKELADAKKKFQEVDDWELSFESCDVNGGSSSPWR